MRIDLFEGIYSPVRVRYRLATVVIVSAMSIGLGIVFFQQQEPPTPGVIERPGGVSQGTVREVRIERPDWLSPDRKRVWVTARILGRRSGHISLLVDLENGTTLFAVDEADPLAWISDHEVLFYNGESADPLWKKLLRRLGGHFVRDYVTRFYRFDTRSREMKPLTDIHSRNRLTCFTYSREGRWGVGTWGPLTCYEITLDGEGAHAEKVNLKYVWTPVVVDEDTYFFVGETSVQSKRVGVSGTRRISQPLLKEIREAVIDRGTPSILLCGRYGGCTFAVDHLPSREWDRLLRVDETTSLVEDVMHLHPSRELPRFNENGTEVVYQGHLFDETMDFVFYQEVKKDAEPIVLVEGERGDIQESTPLFLDDTTVLYVSWGRALLTQSLNSETPTLHWPLELVPWESE